jgi:arylsulfatase A-like enzyme
MYTDPNYRGPKLIHPKYGRVDWMTDAELQYVRGLYAGEVTFVDRWFGRFIDKLRELNLLDESLVILVSDHGHPHGDHGTIMKSAQNLYSELVKVPFMVRFPDKKYAGKRLDAIAQFVDIAPTILDFLGFTDSLEVMQGKSLLPLIRSEVKSIREVARIGVFNYSDRCIRDKDWSYIRRPEGIGDELYNLREDPKEKNNLIETYPEEAKRLVAKLGIPFNLRGPKVSSYQLKYDLEGCTRRFEPVIARVL